MPTAPRPTAGEIEILRVIWAAQECGVREVFDALRKDRKIALTTVATRVAKMEQKGLIQAIDGRRPKLYRAIAQQENTANSLVGDVLKRVFGGSTSRMMVHLLTRKKITPSERKAIQQQLDQMP